MSRWIFFCLDCLEEALARVAPDERHDLAADAAEAAVDVVRIGDEELRAAMRLPSGRAFASALATDARRGAMRRKLRTVVRRNERALPILSAELRALLEESEAAPAADDPLWLALCAVLARRLEPVWN